MEPRRGSVCGADPSVSMGRFSLALGVLLIVPPWATARPRGDEKGPRPRVLKRIGKVAVDCGTYPGAPFFTQREVPAAVAGQVSQCMTDARREHKAFLFTVEMETFSQWMATGLMGTEKGVIEVFWYDLRCPDYSLTRGPKPKCEESFKWYACPVVSTPEMIDPQMKCQDGWASKPAAEQ